MTCGPSANRIFVAEEGGGGKQVLLDRGGYKHMDVCIMYNCLPYFCEKVIYVVHRRSHPGVGPPLSAGIGSTNAMQPMDVEYFGQACVAFPHILKGLTPSHTGLMQALPHGLSFIIDSPCVIVLILKIGKEPMHLTRRSSPIPIFLFFDNK